MSRVVLHELPPVPNSEILPNMRTKIQEAVARFRAGDLDSEDQKVIRLLVPIENVEPLIWLESQGASEEWQNRRVYWSDRDAAWECAAIGDADSIVMRTPIKTWPLFTRLRNAVQSAPPGLRYYGGFCFDYEREGHTRNGVWASFPDCWFMLPRFEVMRYGDTSAFICNLVEEDTDDTGLKAVLEHLEKLLFECPEPTPQNRTVHWREEFPDLPRWQQMIAAAGRLFASDVVKKVVLARRTVMNLSQRISPWMLLSELNCPDSRCYTFGFQPAPGVVFLGSSPERLFQRKGTVVETEALAGTRPRSNNADEDARLEQELIDSPKEQQEHRFVVDGITEELNQQGLKVRPAKQGAVRKYSNVQHLYTPIHALLPESDKKESNYDDLLIRALHPTPAVCGTPREAARDSIAELEPFDRGWYAGPVGWVGEDRTEFAVGIRSALVAGANLTLFNGSGIVKESKADAEWAEIEDKASRFTSLITDEND